MTKFSTNWAIGWILTSWHLVEQMWQSHQTSTAQGRCGFMKKTWGSASSYELNMRQWCQVCPKSLMHLFVLVKYLDLGWWSQRREKGRLGLWKRKTDQFMVRGQVDWCKGLGMFIMLLCPWDPWYLRATLQSGPVWWWKDCRTCAFLFW